MSELRDILLRKREILVKMQELEKDPDVKKYLELRRTSEKLLDYLTIELEYGRLSKKEHDLLGFDNKPVQETTPECNHQIKLLNKQTAKHFECICLECGKKVFARATNNPLKQGILYAQEPGNINLDELRDAIKKHPRLVDIQAGINYGEFDKPIVSKR